jgi:hypothetical protein
MSREATPKTVFFNTKQDNNTVETPDDLFQTLDAVFSFTHDPCPAGGLENPNVPDGLRSKWGLCNYVNPPYSCTELWIKKAVEQLNTRGCESVFLIPVHINTRYWRELVFKHASEVWFIGQRVAFKGYVRKIPTPLCVVVFSVDRIWHGYRKSSVRRLCQIIARRKHVEAVLRRINPTYVPDNRRRLYLRAANSLSNMKVPRKRFTVLESSAYTFYRFSLY